MRLFAVRVIEDRQPVGFFWSTDVEELWDMVDSVTDPGACEYHGIKTSTALVWESAVQWKMGTIDIELDSLADDVADEAFVERMAQIQQGMSFDGSLRVTGTMSRYLSGDEEIVGWKKLPFANERPNHNS